MKKYENLITQLWMAIGGKENIVSCFHCATRLRLQLKDFSVIQEERLDHIDGVIGHRIVAEQLQIIIGPHVQDVYDTFCDMSDLKKEEEIVKKKMQISIPLILQRFVDIVSGSFVPLIPIIISASFIKLLATLLGPSMFNMVTEDSDLFVLFTFVGDSGFYFLPVFIGYSASKKMGVSVVLGMFLGAVMLHPTLNGLVTSNETFTIYGIPMTLTSYSNSTIPMILIIWTMSYVQKGFEKLIPNALRMVFTPLLTMLVMLPVALCLVGPLGVNLSSGLTEVLLQLASFGWLGSLLVSALGGALWNVLVLCGMHLAYYMAGVAIFIEHGSDPLIMTTVVAGTMGLFGMNLGALLKFRNDKENRALVSSYVITQALGGVSEPGLFGIGMRYTRPFIGACIGGAAGAMYYGILRVSVTTMTAASNFLIFTQFTGVSTFNLVHGVIGGVIAMTAACIYTYFFGFRTKKVHEIKVHEVKEHDKK